MLGLSVRGFVFAMSLRTRLFWLGEPVQLPLFHCSSLGFLEKIRVYGYISFLQGKLLRWLAYRWVFLLPVIELGCSLVF